MIETVISPDPTDSSWSYRLCQDFAKLAQFDMRSVAVLSEISLSQRPKTNKPCLADKEAEVGCNYTTARGSAVRLHATFDLEKQHRE